MQLNQKTIQNSLQIDLEPFLKPKKGEKLEIAEGVAQIQVNISNPNEITDSKKKKSKKNKKKKKKDEEDNEEEPAESTSVTKMQSPSKELNSNDYSPKFEKQMASFTASLQHIFSASP